MDELKSAPYRDGWHAHRLGADVKENPFGTGTHSRQKQAWSFAQWQSGWCDRFGAVKHDEDTDTLDGEI